LTTTVEEAISWIGQHHSILDADDVEKWETIVGVGGNPDAPDGLFRTADIAVQDFAAGALMLLSEYNGLLDDGTIEYCSIHFMEAPNLRTWQITVLDPAKNSHRLSESRYSVTAKIGVVPSPFAAKLTGQDVPV
jgi:hypothetical protein